MFVNACQSTEQFCTSPFDKILGSAGQEVIE